MAEDQLEAAKQQQQTPLLFMHHNLLEHNSLLKEGYILDNSAQLQQLLTAYQVPANFFWTHPYPRYYRRTLWYSGNCHRLLFHTRTWLWGRNTY